MANNKSTIEAKIVSYFETADITTARVVLGIVKERVRAREQAGRVIMPQASRKTKKGQVVVEAPAGEN